MADLEHLSLLDISDREVLLMVRDLAATTDGWITSSELSEAMGLIGDNPSRTVSCRLSWMVRFGTMEREVARDVNGNIREHRNGKVMHTQRWRLTDLGLALAVGKLTKTQRASLDKLGDGQMLMAVRWMTQRAQSGDAQIAKLMHREYKNGLQLR